VNPTPRLRGLAMPAEWARHGACWIAWPCRESLWQGRIDAVRERYAAVARAVAEFEPVCMLANPEDSQRAQQQCGATVRVIACPLDDSWLRDSGPTFVTGPDTVVALDWRFNGWGERYRPYDKDDRVAAFIAQQSGAEHRRVDLVLEGGSVHVDGEGTLFTTEQCLLNRNRNPHMVRVQIEAHLRDNLNVERIIWLGEGLSDDETDGHIDNLCFVARPGVLAVQCCEDPADSNYAAYRDNLRRLGAATDARGRRLSIVELPQPPARYNRGQRLPLSYANLYIANGGVVMPGFSEPAHDGQARRVVERLFPDRRIIQIEVSEIVLGGGGIHCITQQQPLPAST
jgi:agmatine deiminase